MAPSASKKSAKKAAPAAEAAASTSASADEIKAINPASVRCKDKRTVMYKKYKKEKKAAKKESREQTKKLREELGDEVCVGCVGLVMCVTLCALLVLWGSVPVRLVCLVPHPRRCTLCCCRECLAQASMDRACLAPFGTFLPICGQGHASGA